jgi:hypothetical protein
MNTKSKIAATVAALAFAVSLAVPTSQAEAKGGKWVTGVAIGLGIATVGAAIATSRAYAEPYYDDEPVRCTWVRQYNKYGEYVGKARVCD